MTMQPEMMEETPDTDVAEEGSESTEIPSTLAGAGVKAGDTISLKVVAVGDGTLTVEPIEEPTMKGSDGMASEFDKPTEENV
jgi:hypothetical protein